MSEQLTDTCIQTLIKGEAATLMMTKGKYFWLRKTDGKRSRLFESTYMALKMVLMGKPMMWQFNFRRKP